MSQEHYQSSHKLLQVTSQKWLFQVKKLRSCKLTYTAHGVKPRSSRVRIQVLTEAQIVCTVADIPAAR
jgi:hypothetical protein